MLLAYVAAVLDRDLRTLSREIGAYADERDLWRLAPGVPNSAGTLALHLAGNIQHYLGARLALREAYRIRGERDLASAVAGVERSDPDWTWERLNAKRTRPPEGKNGAELIPQIKKLSHPDWGRNWRRRNGSRGSKFRQTFGSRPPSSRKPDATSRPPPKR